jgi:UDP-N-acetylmuramyl tripeptide synthase
MPIIYWQIYGTACELGMESLETLIIIRIRTVSGRFHYIVSGHRNYCRVDYAHTPDA